MFPMPVKGENHHRAAHHLSAQPEPSTGRFAQLYRGHRLLTEICSGTYAHNRYFQHRDKWLDQSLRIRTRRRLSLASKVGTACPENPRYATQGASSLPDLCPISPTVGRKKCAARISPSPTKCQHPTARSARPRRSLPGFVPVLVQLPGGTEHELRSGHDGRFPQTMPI